MQPPPAIFELKLKRFSLFLFSTLLLFNSLFSRQPDWVKKRPINNDYYIGIGIAVKGEGREYIQTAKNNALADMSSEIAVNIFSETIDIAVEQSGLSEEEIRSEIRATTQAELDGYELIDTWEGKKEYWVYYRLSKAYYEALMRQKLENAMSLSLDFFSNGKNNEKNEDFSSALSFYLQSLKPIEKYYSKLLDAMYEGEKIFLKNEIISSIQTLLSNIKLKAQNGKLNGKIGQPLSEELSIYATYEESNSVGIDNLPVEFSFVRGSGNLVNLTKTDSRGVAKSKVSKISAHDKIQIVKAELDISNYIKLDSTSQYIKNTVENFSVPSTKFILTISGLSAYVEVSEINLGKEMDVLYVEPKLKDTLTEAGFSFTGDISEADVLITIKGSSRMGAEIYGQYTAFADLTVSVVDMNSGDEVYKNVLQNVKGIHLSYDKAGLKAFENMANEVSEKMVPEIVSAVE